MKIEHIAIWVSNLEEMREFYEKYFGAVSNRKYMNQAREFESYFLAFETGARIEIMKKQDMEGIKEKGMEHPGLAHLAISVGSRERVDDLTGRIYSDGFHVISRPRVTGDGYYESIILDPENNRIEITL
jgi:lactoylglutathione lyase